MFEHVNAEDDIKDTVGEWQVLAASDAIVDSQTVRLGVAPCCGDRRC
jgi:hypothetical protein